MPWRPCTLFVEKQKQKTSKNRCQSASLIQIQVLGINMQRVVLPCVIPQVPTHLKEKYNCYFHQMWLYSVLSNTFLVPNDKSTQQSTKELNISRDPVG